MPVSEETERARAELEQAVQIDYPSVRICHVLLDRMLRVSVSLEHAKINDSPREYRERFEAVCERVRLWRQKRPRFKVVVAMLVLNEASEVQEAFRMVIAS